MLCSKGYDIPINNKSKVKVEVKIYFSSLRTLYNTFVIRLHLLAKGPGHSSVPLALGP